MKLHLQLIAQTNDSSLSVLTSEGHFLAFVLEDGYRAQKIPGQTRIPAGTYPVVRRRVGKFFMKYKERFAHTFVPELTGVPNFEAILIHMGNEVEDTRGCLLVGKAAVWDSLNGLFMVQQSTDAYLELYQRLFKAYQAEEQVSIEINREIPPFQPVSDTTKQNPT